MVHYDLSGRVILVTGAASGIGRAVSRMLAASGGSVAVADRDVPRAQSVVDEIIDAGGAASAYPVDVSDPEAVDAVVSAVVSRHGRLDAAVNNAGIGGVAAPVGDYPVGDWRQVMAVNLDGVFHCCRAEIRTMRRAGGGSIVNMASVLAAAGFPSAPGYVAAKHGVVGLTRAAALDHAADGIRVNAVAPAFIETPMLMDNVDEAGRAALIPAHPLGRLGTPDEVAGLVCWLVSDDAAFATGGYYPVDGGYLAQ